jgi:hypothetical protein
LIMEAINLNIIDLHALLVVYDNDLE